MSDFLLGLVAGVFIGAFGLLALSLMVSASRADDALERSAQEWRRKQREWAERKRGASAH